MSDTKTSLGPLELLDGRWTVGDARRPRAARWVEFRPDGLYAHGRDGEGELVPWSRLMVRIRCTVGAKNPDRGSVLSVKGIFGGLPGPWRGRGSGYLHVVQRHPDQGWSAVEHRVFRFDRHPRWYDGTELLLLDELLRAIVESDEAHRLGDPEWLGRVIAALPQQRLWRARAYRDAVTAALRAGSPTEE